LSSRLDDEAEEVGAEIGVDQAGAGTALQWCFDDGASRLVWRHRDAPQLASRRQPGAMLQELLHGDVVLGAAREARDELRDRVFQANLAVIEQHHDAGGGRDDLGERGKVVDRPGGNDGILAAPAQVPVPLFEDCGAAASDQDRCAREAAGLDGPGDDFIHLFQPFGRHADGRRLLGGQAPRGSAGIGQHDHGGQQRRQQCSNLEAKGVVCRW
jgi:hypothetical protein